MDAFAIAAACAARGLTPDEARQVEATLTARDDLDKLDAGDAQTALMEAMDGVLEATRDFTIFDSTTAARAQAKDRGAGDTKSSIL